MNVMRSIGMFGCAMALALVGGCDQAEQPDADIGPVASESKPVAVEAPADNPAANVTVAQLESGPAPRAGVDYQLIGKRETYAANPQGIEVVEVFSYHCPHCADFEPWATQFRSLLPADANFRYLQLAGGSFEQLARAFFALEAMGALDTTHAAALQAVAIDRKLSGGTPADVAAVFADAGSLDAKALESTMQSFAVDAKVARAQALASTWQVAGTPTMVVDGKYRIQGTQDRGQLGMLRTAWWAIEQARQARAAEAAPAMVPAES